MRAASLTMRYGTLIFPFFACCEIQYENEPDGGKKMSALAGPSCMSTFRSPKSRRDRTRRDEIRHVMHDA